jgi:hypothetical protein
MSELQVPPDTDAMALVAAISEQAALEPLATVDILDLAARLGVIAGDTERLKVLLDERDAEREELVTALREEHVRAVAWETQNGSPVAHQEAVRIGRYDRWAKDCPACAALAHVKGAS